MQVGIAASPLDLPLQRRQPLPDVIARTLHQAGVGQHRQQRRGQAHGDAEGDPVAGQVFESIDERQVGLGQRLKIPLLLKKTCPLGVVDVGQMGVQHQNEGGAHEPPPIWASG